MCVKSPVQPESRANDRGAGDASGVSRRTFLERLFTATIVGAAVPSALRALVPRVTVAGESLSGRYRLDLATIPDLQSVGGSIRITIPEVGPTFRVIVTRVAEDRFEAVNARCPHQGYRVRARREGEDFLECEAHDSRFQFDGSYISGPANGKSLTRYETFYDGGTTLEIEIDELASVGAGGTGRSSIALHSSGPAPGALLFRVTLEHREHLRLSIWSLDGREVARPFEGTLEAGEEYLHADLSSLRSGLYLYRLDGDSGVVGSGKVVL